MQEPMNFNILLHKLRDTGKTLTSGLLWPLELAGLWVESLNIREGATGKTFRANTHFPGSADSRGESQIAKRGKELGQCK